VVWLKRVLLPARVPGVEIPNFSELQELHDMLAERVKTWTQEWKEQGLLEGRQQGRQEGETKLLRRQLTRRFGPLPSWAEERLGQAGETELEEWADRVLECQSLKEVFGGSA
jgi:predicted transposase YdaD